MAPRKTAAAKKEEPKVAVAEPVVEAPAPAAEPTVVEAPAPAVEEAAPTAAIAADSDLTARIAQLVERVQAQLQADRELLAALKTVQKDVARLQKQKESRRGRRGAAAAGGAAGPAKPHKPSGITKPALMTPELCEFLALPKESMLARTDVTRMITKYVKDNQLYDTADKRIIKPDAKLGALLCIKEGQEKELTYFKLQAFIKHHFVKADPAVAVATA